MTQEKWIFALAQKRGSRWQITSSMSEADNVSGPSRKAALLKFQKDIVARSSAPILLIILTALGHVEDVVEFRNGKVTHVPHYNWMRPDKD